MTPAEAFGRALRRRRKAASLTQENLGFEAELARVYISWLERGRKQPTITTVLKLSHALRCSAAELMADTEAQLTHWPVFMGVVTEVPPAVYLLEDDKSAT